MQHLNFFVSTKSKKKNHFANSSCSAIFSLVVDLLAGFFPKQAYILIQCTYPCRVVNFRLHYLIGSFSFISGSVVSMNNFELSLFVFFSPLLSVKQLPQVQVVLLVALKMRRQNLKFCLIQLMQMQFRR